MEHGSIITQARREDALVLTKQGRGATSQNFASPPSGEGAEEPAGPGVRRSSRTRRALGPQWGLSEAPVASAEREGVIRAAVTRRATPPPPRGRQRLGGRASRQATRAAPTRAAEMEWSLLPHHRCAPAPGPRGGHEGSRAGTPPGLEFSRRTEDARVAARGLGTKFTRSRRGRWWGRGEGRGHCQARDSSRGSAEQASRTQGPAGAPPCPVHSPGAAAAHTQPRLFSPGAVSLVT